MPMTFQPAEISPLTGGFLSDAGILAAPAITSKDEYNYELLKTGDRARRLGMQFEANYHLNSVPFSGNAVYNDFIWKNVAQESDITYLVVQAGAYLYIHDLTIKPISSAPIKTFGPWGDGSQRFGLTDIDGMLIVATGDSFIRIVSYENDVWSLTSKRLLIRDSFGCEDTGLTEGSNVTVRPGTLESAHLYNLRNQTWAHKRIDANNEGLSDPISSFYSYSGNTKYPANSDNVTYALWSDANDADDRISERFFPKDLFVNNIFSERAPMGYFIIDALARGQGRRDAVNTLEDDNSFTLRVDPDDLATDRTLKGATHVASYAGRVFYAGFGNEIEGPQETSPRMGGYVLYSQLVQSPANIHKCYQEGDPTSKETPDLVATDGGFLRLDEAYGIQGFVAFGDVLIVIATNGIWAIKGNDSSGFKATEYQVNKISNRGCFSSRSIVEGEGEIWFFGTDGIYRIAYNEFGDIICQNVSFGKIGVWYDNLTPEEKRNSVGNYNSLQKTFSWLLNAYRGRVGEVFGLIYYQNFQCFVKTHYTNSVSDNCTLISVFSDDLLDVETRTYDVFSDSDQVFSEDLSVIVAVNQLRDIHQDNFYVVLLDSDDPSNVNYTIANKTHPGFLDWVYTGSDGVDADAYMLTNAVVGGDSQRRKTIEYLTVHMKRTENAITLDSGNLVLVNPSSCQVRTRWNFSSNARTGKWSRWFEAYKLRRAFLYSTEDGNFSPEFELSSTRNRIRGSGISFSIEFKTSPKKDSIISGIGMIIGSNSNV